MKRRVAVVSSSCPPLPGRPVTGGGLRTEQLVQTLRAAGHSVTLFVERAALGEDPPGDLRPFDLEGLAAELEAARPSVVVLEQWALADHVGDGGKPLVIDLHGSLLLENVYRRGELDLTLDAEAKLRALRRADLLLSPAPAQLHHFASWATLAGFDPREPPLALLPLALPGEPTRRDDPHPSLRLVYGGARWPWIDSLAALDGAAEAVGALPGATLDVFTYDPPRHGLPLEEDLGTWTEVDAALTGRPGVTLHDATAQDAYGRFLRREATVALDLWAPNPERVLAATTRSGEFLHAGLPVITAAGSAWAEELVASGAGWSLPPGDPGALTALLRELSEDPERIAAASRAASDLMAGPHELLRAGEALLAFVASPSRPARAPRSLIEDIVAVEQAHLDERLRSLEEAHRDEHQRLVAAHRQEVEALRAAHRLEVTELSTRHEGIAGELRAAHRADVERISGEAREAAEAARQDRARELQALEALHRARLEEHVLEHRAAQQQTLAEHRAQAEAQREAAERALSEAGAERRAEVQALAAEARDQGERQERRHRAGQAEQQARLEEAVAGHRAEMEAEAARHRAEMEQAVASWQQRLEVAQERARTEHHQAQERARSDRHRAREARTRLEVELRAELARTEERLLAADRAASPFGLALRGLRGALPLLPGRLRPALRLARLWVEHAADRGAEGPGPGEG